MLFSVILLFATIPSMKKQSNMIRFTSILASLVITPLLSAQTVEGQFWAHLQVSTPEAGYKLEYKPITFSGAFDSVSFTEGFSEKKGESDAAAFEAISAKHSDSIYGNWSVDVSSDLGSATWDVVDKTKLFFNNAPSETLVFTNPSIDITKFSDDIKPFDPVFFAGITPDEMLLKEISQLSEKGSFSIFVTDGKGFVEVISKDFTFELGASKGKEGGLGYDPEIKGLSTAGLSYVFSDGKEFQEFKNGKDFNTFAQFGSSYKCGPIVPEPSSALLALASASLLIRRRRK